MRIQAMDSIVGSENDVLLTTGEVASILNTSRQHVVDLCDQGLLPFVTTGSHRRIRRSDVEALQTRTYRLTRDQKRSLWLGYAVAGMLVADPEGVVSKAKKNLAHLKRGQTRGVSRAWLSQWERILSGPIDGILDVLTSRSPRARELRQNSPFAGVLNEAERQEVLSRLTSSTGWRQQ